MKWWTTLKRRLSGLKAWQIILLLILPTLLLVFVGLLIAFGTSLIPRGLRSRIPIQTRWKKLLSQAQQGEIIQAARQLKVSPNWIIKTLWIESRLNPRAYNESTKASGLWQALPNTIQWLGLNSPLMAYSFDDQISYLIDYVERLNVKVNSESDFYLAIFYPAAIGKPKSYVFPDVVRRFNQGLNVNKDSVLTKRDIIDYIARV